jgi:predicted HD phosphohydrolase
MTADLAQRLRDADCRDYGMTTELQYKDLLREAADTIERLIVERDRTQEWLDKFQGEAAAQMLKAHQAKRVVEAARRHLHTGATCDLCAALAAYDAAGPEPPDQGGG